MLNVYEKLLKFKDDPEAFRRESKQIIDETIASYSEEKQIRMRSLQWSIDQELSNFKDPVARLNHIISMFYTQLDKFNDALQGNIKQHTKSAPVLEFKKRDS